MRTIILFSVFMFWSVKSIGQISGYDSAKKHAFSVFGGYSENGYSLLGSYNFYNSNKAENLNDFIELSLLASFVHESKTDYEIPVQVYSINVGYFKNSAMFSGTSKQLNIAIGGGGLIGYENINNGNNELPNGSLIVDESKIIYGGFVGIDANIFITSHFSITSKTNLYYHPNSEVGKAKFIIGIGLKYSILKKIKQ